MRIMKTLITDRTQADASYAEKLYKKLWSDFTEQEKADFEAGLKGSYKASDLNRERTVSMFRQKCGKIMVLMKCSTKTLWTLISNPRTPYTMQLSILPRALRQKSTT